MLSANKFKGQSFAIGSPLAAPLWENSLERCVFIQKPNILKILRNMIYLLSLSPKHKPISITIFSRFRPLKK